MERDVRREATSTTRKAGLLRKSVAQLAVLGLIAGGAVFALSASATAGKEMPTCVQDTHDHLNICKSGPATAVAGTDISYTLSATLDGDHDDTFAVTDPLPPGVLLAGLPTGTGWDCTGSTPTAVSCVPDGSVKNEDVGDITVPAHVVSAYVGEVPPACNTASVTRTEGEDVSSVEAATQGEDENATVPSNEVCTTVTQVADLAVTKSGPASATVGDTVNYTVTVTNNGPSDSNAIHVNDPIPTAPGLQFATAAVADENGWTCVIDGSNTMVDCDHAALAAGASSSFTVTLQPLPSSSATSPLENCATATAGEAGEVSTDNNTGCTSLDPTVNGGVITVKAAEVTKVQPNFPG
jgi:uncharacterized repeat protein (TIGR01451 family)